MAQRGPDRRRAIRHAELGEHSLEAESHRIFTDVEDVGDVFVAATSEQQANGPVARGTVRWAFNVSRGAKDLRQTFTPAESLQGGTIGPVAQR